MNLILRENLRICWSVELIWNTDKAAVNVETQTFCAQGDKMLVPEFAITVTFSARNVYRGKWSIQNHEECIMKNCTLHLSHRTPFNSRSRHQSWRSKTQTVLHHLSPVDSIHSDPLSAKYIKQYIILFLYDWRWTTVSQLKLSVAGSPTRRPSFITRALLVGAKVDIISLWQAFLQDHLLLLSVVILRLLHIHLSVAWNMKMGRLDFAFPLRCSLTPTCRTWGRVMGRYSVDTFSSLLLLLLLMVDYHASLCRIREAYYNHFRKGIGNFIWIYVYIYIYMFVCVCVFVNLWCMF